MKNIRDFLNSLLNIKYKMPAFTLSILFGSCTLLAGICSLFFDVPVFAALPDEGYPRGQDAQEAAYREYIQAFEGIMTRDDIAATGFRVIDKQIFPIYLETFGEVSVVPAYDGTYRRLALFLVDTSGRIVYKTEQLETNNRVRGELRQPNVAIAAVSFQDMNEDGLTDIGLITTCVNRTGDNMGKTYKVGDVLFQSRGGFYRDYRLSDKINRFSMNKSIEMIVSYIRDGQSTEFLYTAATLEELLENGFQIIPEQHYVRNFEKLGRLEIVPGVYTQSYYTIFMIYLVNEQGYIVWSLQPMGEFDNLYALKGMAWQDIDGDSMRDIVVLGHYSYESRIGRMVVESDYAIYYQRTGGFSTDTEFKRRFRCTEETRMEELIGQARSYWGWQAVQDD